jgi:organic radical activating enzyme
MITLNDDPNFSIVLQGPCNADCKFCFSKNKKVGSSVLADYLNNLNKTLKELPEQFYQISITGQGEPLLSSRIVPVLSSIIPHRTKYTNVLLTTNGTRLLEMVDIVCSAVDHINISRHHWDEVKNKEIFGGSYSVMDGDLVNMISECSKYGVDIGANCVINDSTDREFIEKYIAWASSIGFTAIRFRKENGTLDKTPVEETFADHKVLWSGSCPVCRTDLQMILGKQVYWKSSVIEPSDHVDKIFEVVFAPDGNNYADWEYTKPVKIVNANEPKPIDTRFEDFAKRIRDMEEKQRLVNMFTSNACGSSRSRSSSGCGRSSSC